MGDLLSYLDNLLVKHSLLLWVPQWLVMVNYVGGLINQKRGETF